MQYIVGKNVPVLGIEPAANVAAVAQQKGIPKLVQYFGQATAQELTPRAYKQICWWATTSWPMCPICTI